MTHLHNLIIDQPMHPLDRAVWWMEYLLRHPSHEDQFRNDSADDSEWRYFWTIVPLLVVVITIIFFIITYSIHIFAAAYKRIGSPKMIKPKKISKYFYKKKRK